MKRQTLFLIAGTIAAFFSAVAVSRYFLPVIHRPLPIAPSAAPISKRELVGVNSCSASACHGGVETGARLSETATWRALDPHARAYATLLSPESRNIAKQLWDGTTQAHEAPLCLKCHVHSTYEQARPNFRKQDGVACESCHGAAGEWLTPHYRPGWKPSLGMLDTKSLAGRANICATCHVGTPDANVDHDLIAAGHPALRFEFATYFANLPPHWDVAKDRKANTKQDGIGFDFQAWVIGQWVSSAAASELLAHRASDGKIWPEFAELDCFACHHDLQEKRWRNPNVNQNKRGSLRLNDWYRAMPAMLNQHLDVPLDFIKDRVALAKTAKAHAKLQREIADRGEVEAHHIANWKAAAARLWKMDGQLEGDLATQMYLALIAAGPTIRHDGLIERLRRDVTFPPGYASPKR